MAKVTHTNVLTQVRGLFCYTFVVLLQSEDVRYAPALHSNQSSVEGLFSSVRYMNRNRIDMYAGGEVQQNMFCHLSSKKKKKVRNTSYPKEIIGYKSNFRAENDGAVFEKGLAHTCKDLNQPPCHGLMQYISL